VVGVGRVRDVRERGVGLARDLVLGPQEAAVLIQLDEARRALDDLDARRREKRVDGERLEVIGL
jgi:hypothetical protein